MDFDSNNNIEISLDWDNSDSSTRVGTYDSDYLLETNTHNLNFNLYIYVEAESEEGDHWSPPTSDVGEEIIEIKDLQVYNLMDEEILYTKEEYKELREKIKELINYT